MKSFRKELWFEIPTRRGLVNITPYVQEAMLESEITEGLCLVNAMHITASVLSMTTNPACTRIMMTGWKSWLRMPP